MAKKTYEDFDRDRHSYKIKTNNRPPEIDLRKSMHLSLLPATHAEFRVLCFRRGLSMQEALEEIINQAVEGRAALNRILDEAVDKKRNAAAKSLMSNTDAESILREIELESPFNEKRYIEEEEEDF